MRKFPFNFPTNGQTTAVITGGDITKAEEEMKVESEDTKLSVPSPDTEIFQAYLMQFVS